ncbi:MAG: hypothetical protein IKI22_01100 [Neisseriaceae bacterium]|nr:hypothetical protein [Neisseriaceae bacterium]
MKKLGFLLLPAILVACSPSEQTTPATPAESVASAPVVEEVLEEKTVNYACVANGERIKVAAVYQIKDDDVVSAKLSANGVDYPVLKRNFDDKDSNSFADDKYIWVSELASAQEVEKTHGNMLTEKEKTVVNGENVDVDNIIFKYCELVTE